MTAACTSTSAVVVVLLAPLAAANDDDGSTRVGSRHFRERISMAARILEIPLRRFYPNEEALWNVSAGEQVHDSYAAWACHLVNSSGITAAAIVLERDHLFSLRCCSERCATTSCESLDKSAGPGAHLPECGACPRTAAVNCGPGARRWDGTNELEVWQEEPPPWWWTTCKSHVQHNATNALHLRYFQQQQAAEQQLLDRMESELCTGLSGYNGDDAESLYQRRLHLMLAPYRMSTRLHVTFAFLAKSDCVLAVMADRSRANLDFPPEQQASFMNGFFKHSTRTRVAHTHGGEIDWDRLESPWVGRAPAYVLPQGEALLPLTPSPTWHVSLRVLISPVCHVAGEKLLTDDTDWCFLPILRHEPYNVKESWHVWNYTRDVLSAGASFCSRPPTARTALFAAWRERQEEIMAWHRANMAFAAYPITYLSACATLAANIPGGVAAAQRIIDIDIERDVHHGEPNVAAPPATRRRRRRAHTHIGTYQCCAVATV